MCKKLILHILLVIVTTPVILGGLGQEEDPLSCGPLKARLSEYDACYDPGSNEEVPCSLKSKEGTRILKVCRSPYSWNVKWHKEILNTTYTCKGRKWWPPYDNCQSDCGQSRVNNKYPWLAAIYDENEELKCTGTVVSAYHVLTAFTCFVLEYIYTTQTYTIKDAFNYTVIVGKHYSNIHRKKKSAQIRKIKKAVAVNQSARYFTINDILLIEVDSEFDFFDDVQPACIDWFNYYEQNDFTEGNEAVAVGWDYNKGEMVPCEDSNEFNLQFWHTSTCRENSISEFWRTTYMLDKFCGTYVNGNQSTCGKSKGAGLFFKSSPWRYYLRGITTAIIMEPNVTHILYTTLSLFLTEFQERMKLHPNINHDLFFSAIDVNLSKRKTGCKLPEHVRYGKFKLVMGDAYRMGAWVPTDTRILLVCIDHRNETHTSTQCRLGEWQPPIEQLECKRPGTCPALRPSASEDVFCRFKGQKASCEDPSNNTTAITRCKPFHVFSGHKPIYNCEGGSWDQPFAHCTLECGTKRVGVTTLAIGGSEVIKNEYPWVAAVYLSTEQICGGTIISRSYVLSAAHCFTTSKGMIRNKELYTIFAGKHYRDFGAEESSAQSKKIKTIYIHDDYKGNLHKYRDDIALIELDTELTPSLDVQPACVDWDNLYEDFDFIDGNNAVVAGWGYTRKGGAPSSVLKKLVLPYRPKDVCIANLPEDFSHQYVATDKICAGYIDNNMNVCQGDSGGGLYFRSADGRYYVRGIVSLTVKTEAGNCQPNKFALYTKVSRYLEWIETITRRLL